MGRAENEPGTGVYSFRKHPSSIKRFLYAAVPDRSGYAALPGYTATECSKWADSFRSLVTAVHWSARMSTSWPPAAAWVLLWPEPCPSSTAWNAKLVTKFGISGFSCRLEPIPWPTKRRMTEYPPLGMTLHRMGDVVNRVAGFDRVNGFIQAFLGHPQKPGRILRNGAHAHGARGIAIKPLEHHAHIIKADDVSSASSRLAEGNPWTISSFTEQHKARESHIALGLA